MLSRFIKKKRQTTKRKLSSDFIAAYLWQDIRTTIDDKMFQFFTDNESISSYRSGFKPKDFCFNQLLCISHDIYQSFDDGLETRAVFLDISKAYDKVWYEGLLYKLKQNSISGNLLKIIKYFLSLRKQRVEWAALNMG